jgi:tetratricopeptide (TPR) repeat protein
MPGNRQIFEQAMNLGHSAAWDQEWEKAIAAYTRAIKEIPEDPQAYNSLGFALLQARQYDNALKVYSRAAQMSPDDPLPLEKIADVLERLGRLKEAAQAYINVADIYLAQGDLEKSIGNWERATLLTPGLIQIHYRLAQAYERTGRKRAAVMQYLTMAFNFQRSNDKVKALQSIERSLRLEPSNPQVLNAKRAIESGELMAVPKTGDETADDEPRSLASTRRAMPEPEVDTGGAHPLGPLGEATDKALATLAEHVLEGDLSASTAMAIQGIELTKIEAVDEALSAFAAAEKGGMRYPALYMCMGKLYIDAENWQQAQKYLDRVRIDNTFAPGASHGLGLVYVGLNQHRRATEQLIHALELADTQLAMNPDEAAQLVAVYQSLLKSTQGMQEADLATMNGQFLRWLSGSEWKIRIPETRRALADRLRTGDANELKYYVTNTEIVDMVTKIDRYIRQRMFTLAMDEAFFAIEIEPYALPIHQRIAQILMEEGHIQEAIAKYNLVADSFLARDDRAAAADILNEVVKVAPMDIGIRTSLIDLLDREGQHERMLDEYIGLADAHYQLADMEQARATYQEAVRLSQRLNAAPPRRAEILHHIADIDLSRLDLRQALRTYEQIRNLTPDDERTKRALIDIHYRLNNPVEAVKELDGLLRLFAQQKRGDQIVSTLENLVLQRSNDMALRSRLAAVYRQVNRKQDAIAQLDALGELQLEAGLYQDACATVKQIVALGPSDMEQYKRLLAQLGC